MFVASWHGGDLSGTCMGFLTLVNPLCFCCLSPALRTAAVACRSALIRTAAVATVEGFGGSSLWWFLLCVLRRAAPLVVCAQEGKQTDLKRAQMRKKHLQECARDHSLHPKHWLPSRHLLVTSRNPCPPVVSQWRSCCRANLGGDATRWQCLCGFGLSKRQVPTVL